MEDFVMHTRPGSFFGAILLFKLLLTTCLVVVWGQFAFAADPQRSACFGDLHMHTKYSFDAFIFETRADPDDAYRFAKGKIVHPRPDLPATTQERAWSSPIWNAP